MKSLFPYVGNKKKMLGDIMPLIPTDVDTYVEPFCGGANLLWNVIRDRSNFINFAIGDVNEDLINAYDALKEFELDELCDCYPGDELDKRQSFVDKFKLAGRPYSHSSLMYFYLKSKGCFMSKTNSNRLYRNDCKFTRSEIERYKNMISLVDIYLSNYGHLIDLYDTTSTFFFLDPPYEESTYNNYYPGGNSIDYEQFALQLRGIKGKFLLTINDSEFIRSTFKGFNINSINVKSGHSGVQNGKYNNKAVRQELIITNF